MYRKMRPILTGGVCLLLIACNTRHQVAVAPVEVKPIHITIDVNVKVDRALDRYFEDIDAAREKIK
jgi:hypothetical protein